MADSWRTGPGFDILGNELQIIRKLIKTVERTCIIARACFIPEFVWWRCQPGECACTDALPALFLTLTIAMQPSSSEDDGPLSPFEPTDDSDANIPLAPEAPEPAPGLNGNPVHC